MRQHSSPRTGSKLHSKCSAVTPRGCHHGGLGDIFDLQDQVTESVVGAIAPAVEKAEIERAKRKPTESLDAHAVYLRGLAKVYQVGNRQTNEEALRLFNSATELDPEFASAYSRAASCYAYAK